MPSRGEAISSYYPEFKGTSGIKIYSDNIKCQTLSGTIISANIVYGISHNLGKVPKTVIVRTSLTKAQAASTYIGVHNVDQASANTSAKFYVCGNAKGIKFRAYLQC